MVCLISAEDTIEVRWPILRPGFPRDTAIFPGDNDPETRHFGAYLNEKLVGVASIFRAPMPDDPVDRIAWQLRGMATLPSVRGSGFGRALLEACEVAAHALGVELLWCNARIAAAPFYQLHGWIITGEQFEIPTVGPHFRMLLRLP